MSLVITLDPDGVQSCAALGHPSECTEPAPGSVVLETDHSVTITNSSGEQSQVATIDSANMYFPSHAHAYDPEQGCISVNDHSIDPDTSKTSSVRINGSPAYLKLDSVTTDPDSGGSVNIVSEPVNNSVTQT